MTELVVKPWRVPGKERLYVNKAGTRGDSVAWLDCKSGVVTVGSPEFEALALAKVEEWCRSFGGHVPPRTVRHQGKEHPRPKSAPIPVPQPRAEVPFLPPMRDEDDLARNLPGAGLESLVREGEERYGLLVRLAAKVTRQRLGDSSTLRGLEGEQIVGARLEPLKAAGWKVLHGVPLPSGSDIDHVVIGPPGVFTINSKHHPGATVWVGDKVVKVNRNGFPYLENSEFEASRAAKLLTEWCGFEVPVHPVIAVVGAQKITLGATPGVTVIDGEQIASVLPARPEVLSPNRVDRVFTIARHRHVWSQLGKRGRKTG
ncbi:nuclease-related domain-containing protein [Streptomyces sp. NRRL S-350]|uniref:nuclease-related domain-containing protein n=1 Tax=Streptomyces sp. NRRL S-350 TaxID=1463902 RepID=UPI0006919B21|nr:nuclease-related domain-containing protein [Streptomyces sp. NRRL S-350]